MKYIENLLTLINKIITWLISRKPSRSYIALALSGKALMVWTPTGNIVVSSETARKLSAQLNYLADKAEEYHAAQSQN